jgi:hypothetical protein
VPCGTLSNSAFNSTARGTISTKVTFLGILGALGNSCERTQAADTGVGPESGLKKVTGSEVDDRDLA